MIILLPQDAGPSDKARVLATLRALDIVVDEVRLDGRDAWVVTGGDRTRPAESIARIPGVERVVSLDERTTLSEATRREGPRCVTLGPGRFGGGQVGVIAGPCTVESDVMLRRAAEAVRAAGAVALRGGVFKVRTSPHSFQGGGLAALERLHAVSRETGLPFLTELSDPRQVAEVADLVDGIQIGARHMQNFPLLLEAAALGKPVLLKRHWGADVDEWLLAAEYVLQAGNEDVLLCERGVKTSDRHVRYLLDVGVVPYLKQRVGLPVLVDPSHAAGRHDLVPPLARAAIAAGADGLIVEVHPSPEWTRCDAYQALPPADFQRLMDEVRQLAAMTGRTVSGPPARPGESGAVRNTAVGA